MVDNRFFPLDNHPTLDELLECASAKDGLDVSNADLSIQIVGASTVPFLEKGELGFVASEQYVDALKSTKAGIVILPENMVGHCPAGTEFIVSSNPYKTFTLLITALYENSLRTQYAGLKSWSAALEAGDVEVGEGCDIAPNVMVGDNVKIGDDVVLGPNSVLGRGVTVGRGSTIADNVSIYFAHVGDKCLIHSGVRIGADGFGFLPDATGPRKIPQLGRVVIQDDVEIGTNTSIDRGTLDDTIIGEQTKIDNLVQIAHNSIIGRRCQLSGHVGLAGSAVLGDGVLLAGRAGISNKVKVGDGAIVFACSLVTKDVPEGSMVGGSPATDIKLWRKEVAAIRRLVRPKK
ncbi:UDP-3-O-(3-hydroxymyristoyl)glucosamine N-acyltransferase [Maritalea sp.]|uniref:UDP-3-O-(3-hydroxymyristoyl)glucosamine N-acyltransferase n=1 Tax=Maritalea sp. TaxID=2003361 RepID=UPI003EF34D35